MGKGNEAIRNFFNKHEINYLTYIDNELIPDPNSYDIVVKSSGINFNTPFLVNNKKPVVTDLELAEWFDNNRNKVVVTGTNGKTTTTTLIYKILKSQMKVVLAGNIGIPIFSVIEEEGVMVIEASSFMLHNVDTFHPQVSVLLNLFPNHLEYHQSFESYVGDKLKIVKNSTDDDYIIYNVDDILINAKLKTFKGKKIPFSVKRKVKGAYLNNDALYYEEEKIIDKSEILILGTHNIYNILASIAVAKTYQITTDNIINTIKNFKGIEHRLEIIDGKVPVINDSKSTNPLALLSALNCFKDKKVLLIAGGKDKNDDFNILLNNLNNVKLVLLYGENKGKLKDIFESENITTILFNKLDDVFENITSLLRNIDLILFSPGSSSLDQYQSFEHRGNHFKNLVKKWQL